MSSDQQKRQNNFKASLKGTSLFGGVQVFQILIAIIRSKVLAVFLGPTGVGVLGMLNSSLDVVYSISNLGLATSAIRDISEANQEENRIRLSKISKIFKNIVWGTGIFGCLLCLVLSPYWSVLSFGNHDYTITFALLSVTVFFRLLSEGQNALLQGTQNLRLMAKSNVLGNALGLLSSLPCYYFWGVAGIGPSIFLMYLINLILSWYYSNKIKLEKAAVTIEETFSEGYVMLKLGFFISLSALLTTGTTYIIRIFIGKDGGLEDVGLYTAGFAIINTYVGMIFSAMSKEYFPRLSSVAKDSEAFSVAINQQMQMSIILIAPFISVFMIFCKIGIGILYSNEFLGIDLMLCFAILAILFKAPSWCCSYAIIAKRDSKVFFWGEFVSLCVMLVANLTLYYFLGLVGLGVAYIIIYIYYMIQEWAICKKRYRVKISSDVIKIYIPHFLLCLSCFIISLSFSDIYRYLVGIIPIFFSFLLSFKQLNEKINIIGILKSKLK